MEGRSLLVFSRTTGFRHDSIPAGILALDELGARHGFTVDATEDPARFTPAELAGFAAVVFLSTSGDVLDEHQRAAFEAYLRGGGGFVGIHGATTAEPSSAFYGELLGVRFAGHPEIQPARLVIVDGDDPSLAGLAQLGTWRDEWYNFRGHPRDVGAHVLLEVDETTYSGGTMGVRHPVAWRRQIDAGRCWYTALGHDSALYREPALREHLLGGVTYAAAPPARDAIRAYRWGSR